MNNTIIIVAKETAISRVSISNCDGKIVAKKFAPTAIVTSGKAISRINALNDIVACLKQIDAKTEIEGGPIKILTIDMVLNPITNGTPLFWFMNDGKTSSGEELSDKELNLWHDFYYYYGRNITKVIFDSVSRAATFTTHSKYPITRDMKTIAEYIKHAWEDVDARTTVSVEDVETDEI